MNTTNVVVHFVTDVAHRVATSQEAKNFVKFTEEKAKEAVVYASRRLFRKGNNNVIGKYELL